MIVLFVVFDDFNPRSSCEERRQSFDHSLATVRISIHAPHARSDRADGLGSADEQISIHAPHARSDAHGLRAHRHHHGISIHAPHARSDRCWRRWPSPWPNFNPRSSCEERRKRMGIKKSRGISIHAPHARSDANGHASRSGATYFNPRSSCEERQVINKE